MQYRYPYSTASVRSICSPQWLWECRLGRNIASRHALLRPAYRQHTSAQYSPLILRDPCKVIETSQVRKRKKIPYRPCTTSPYSLVISFPVTMLSPRGAKPHPPGPNALFRIRLYLISGRYTIPSGLTSTSSGSIGASRISEVSGGKAALPSP